MPLSWDPEIVEAVLLMVAGDSEPIPQLARGDWQALRAFGDDRADALDRGLPPHSSISRRDFTITSHDNAELSVRWYSNPTRDERSGSSAVLYLHGGGMIMGSVQGSDHSIAGYVCDSGVPMLAVDYRLAPEHPHPTPVQDCQAALLWLQSHSASLGVDPARIAVMGESAGGGLAAATALLARDGGMPIASQILVYPMLDDRTITPDPVLDPLASWTYDNNFTGWRALVGEGIGGPKVPPQAAPARATDLVGVADAYIEVGELDIFRNECLEYAHRLLAAGSSVELHVHRGCPHGFDRVAPDAAVTRRARIDRIRMLRSL